MLLSALLIALPLAASAQETPLVVGKPQPTAAEKPYAPWEPGFPNWAITKAGEKTAGNENPQPDTPASPPAPVNAATPAAPITPVNPTPPDTPEALSNKLWPRDTVPIFVKSCAGFRIQLVPACQCVIGRLMAVMPHDEFLKLSANGSIEQDSRLVRIRHECVAAGTKKE